MRNLIVKTILATVARTVKTLNLDIRTTAAT